MSIETPTLERAQLTEDGLRRNNLTAKEASHGHVAGAHSRRGRAARR